MLPSHLIKAKLVDIISAACDLPGQMVVDANVLYLWFYPNFDQLEAVNADRPTTRQRREYPKCLKRLLEAKVQLYTSAFTMAEVATTAEVAELQYLWLSDPNQSKTASFKPKAARMAYARELATIRERVDQVLARVSKSVALLPKPASMDREVEEARALWRQSAGDFGDAMLVTAARRVPILTVLSDDADLLSFEGLTLYTANKNAIEASAANRMFEQVPEHDG
jgi:hypothetical protein